MQNKGPISQLERDVLEVERLWCVLGQPIVGEPLDLTKPEDRKKLMESVKSQTCAKFVKGGARLLAEELQNI